jgi:intracellular sulfur oxidation DsrE/DsrF family protein
MSRQGGWVRLIHKGREVVICALTVTRVDVHRDSYGEAVTIYQQGLTDWVRLSDLPASMGVRIRDELLGLDGEWQ